MALDFLVRMRYDANEATHVKDLVGGYTITTNTGGAVPAAADPFGGNNALDIRDLWIYYNGAKAISGTKATVCFWFKPTDDSGNLLSNDHNGDEARSIIFDSQKIYYAGNARFNYKEHPSINITKEWHFVEVSTDGNIVRLFIDGVLAYQGIDSGNAKQPNWKDANGRMIIGNWGYKSNYKNNHCQCYLYDFCILNGVWHTENYNVPTAYIQLEKQGLCISNSPINLLNKTSITGITTEGIQPANTSCHVAFKVDDVWNKLKVSSGTAELTALETQEITADSLIAEGNTVAELQSVTDCTPFVGKLVYPAVALYADAEAEVMPTFGMTVNALIDTTVNVYSYTDYSQEYAISDGDDVSIISLVAETELKGNGKVDITARIKSNGEWSEYMSLNAVQMKQASAIQLKAVYTVSNTDGSDSAKITGVVIKYNTAGAVTSNATTEIVTVTQKFTNDLTYVHAYCKHKELIDAKINAYCSIRKQPQKRVQYQVGNGTGALKTYTLPDSGVNQDTLAVYVDGKFISDFGYNTETSEITLTADKDAVVSASYEYGWEMSDWLPMEQGASQINDSGNYTTEYTYTIPSHDGIFTVTAVKFELARPEGHVDNETIGTGTGRCQMIRLPHIARKETIVCNGKWSYDYDNQRLTIIAPENEPIVISYDWIAESPKVYSIAAGWAD